MPIYEFECTACKTVFDRLQKLSDPDPTECPECGATHVKRRLTAPAFRLAGSGWYETDFKKDGDRKRNLVAGDEPPKPKDDDKAGRQKDGAKADGAKGESAKSDHAKSDSGKSDSSKSDSSKADSSKSESANAKAAPSKSKQDGAASA